MSSIERAVKKAGKHSISIRDALMDGQVEDLMDMDSLDKVCVANQLLYGAIILLQHTNPIDFEGCGVDKEKLLKRIHKANKKVSWMVEEL